jgi:tetratricopeptide (TPR) repeat protein
MLLGRGAMLRRVREASRTHRVVGVVGLAGLGKTALLRALVDAAPAPTQGLVACAAGWDAVTLAAALETRLGIAPAGFAPSLAERGTRIAEALDAAGAIAVVDDLQKCARPGELVAPLVRALERGRLLYASRELLRLEARADAEQLVVELEPLPPAAARTLARRVLHARGLRGEALGSGIDRVTRRAHGNPLAIKLGAARDTDAAEILVSAVLSDLSNEEREALRALAVHRLPVCAEAPAGLLGRFLVQRHAEGLVVHDLVREALGPQPPAIHLAAVRRYELAAGRDPAAAREWLHQLGAARACADLARALERVAVLLWRARDFGAIERALAATRSAPDVEGLGPRARLVGALVAARDGRLDEAQAALDGIAKRGERGELPSDAAMLYHEARARVGYARGDRRQVADAVGEMERLGPECDVGAYLAGFHLETVSLCDEGRAAAALARVQAAERRFGRERAVLAWQRGDALLHLGQARAAIAAYERALGAASGELRRVDVAFVHYSIADARLELGEIPAARRALDAALTALGPLGLRRAEAVVRARRAFALRAEGRWPEALAALDPEIEELGRWPMYRVQCGEARIERARIRLDLGDLEGAADDAAAALATASHTAERTLGAEARLCLAEVALAHGRLDEAERRAVEAERRAGRRATRARAAVVRGRLVLARGDRAAAQHWSARALALAGEAGPRIEAYALRAEALEGAAALAALDDALSVPACDARHLGRLHAARAALHEAAGDVAAARSDLERARERFACVGADTSAIDDRLGRLAFAPTTRFVVDPATETVLAFGRRVHLGAKPILWRLFGLLLARYGRPVSKAELFTALWRQAYRPDLHDRNVYETVRRLRRLLDLPERPSRGRVALISTAGGYLLDDGGVLDATPTSQAPAEPRCGARVVDLREAIAARRRPAPQGQPAASPLQST